MSLKAFFAAKFLTLFFYSEVFGQNSFPLFKAYPSLEKKIPRVEFLTEQTPLQTLLSLQKNLYAEHQLPTPIEPLLWIKRDDNSSQPLGGNKARKLEFLIADALSKKAKHIVTSGMLGSNHALATALAVKKYGLKTTLILGPQPITENVRKKLLSFHAIGANLRFHSNLASMGFDILNFLLQSYFMPENGIYNIPPGGSTEVGSLGYVNAFFELVEQVGLENLPTQIVVPLGSKGTTVGLLVGSCLAGAWEKVKIVGVDVSGSLFVTKSGVKEDAQDLYDFIKSHLSGEECKKLPKCKFKKSKTAFEYVGGYYKPEYGSAKPEVYKTIDLLKESENITLDITYSGKAMQFLLDRFHKFVSNNKTPPKTLFWLTYNSYDLDQIISSHNWTNPQKKWLDLPASFWPIYKN